MDLSDQFVKPKKGSVARAPVKLTLQVGGTKAEAVAALDAYVPIARKLKVGRRLGASELIKAERA